MKKKALEYLETDEIFHMGMIFPIKRNTAEILFADKDGVLLKELESGTYMLSLGDIDKGIRLLDSIGKKQLYCVHQLGYADYLVGKYGFKTRLTCFQAVYRRKERVDNKGGVLDIRRLDTKSIDTVYEHYNTCVDYEYVKRRLECGEIYGGFLGDELCGFVGTHEEGSIGILEVFEGFRKRGYGAELEGYIINTVLERGQTPFSQISVDNEVSMKLHKKLGFEISSHALYWVF